jgi:hypothetical protein
MPAPIIAISTSSVGGRAHLLAIARAIVFGMVADE